MDKNYGGVIWTNHALQRLKDRDINQGDAWATWRRPDQSRYAKSQGAWIYNRICNSQKIEVVAKKNERSEWIILSVWSRPLNSHSSEVQRRKGILKQIIDFLRNKK